MYTLSIRNLVENLIDSGYAEEQSMSADQYRAIWGTEVLQPEKYHERLDLPLLVDNTMDTDTILRCNSDTIPRLNPDACRALAPQPMHPKTGALLTRWVAFVRFDYDWKRNEAGTSTLPEDEVDLTATEGMHLPAQYQAFARPHPIYCLGSRYGKWSVPRLYWRDYARPMLIAAQVHDHDPNAARAVRGTYVVPIT